MTCQDRRARPLLPQAMRLACRRWCGTRMWALYPVVTYQTRYLYTQAGAAGVNRFQMNDALAGPESRRAVTPNATTLYGACFIDLSAEPFVIEMPALEGRYFSLQMMDHYGDYFLEAGEPFTGTDARRFVLCGPTFDGRLPASFNMREVIAAPSDTVWAILRVAVMDRSDRDLNAAPAFLGGVVASGLRDYQGGVTDRPKVAGGYVVHPRMPELSSLFRDASAGDFFEILGLCLNDPTFTKRTDSVAERDMLARLAKIGLGGNQPFAFDALAATTQRAFQDGYDAAKQGISHMFATSMIDMNGWSLGTNWGWFGTDFERRAMAGAFGWGGAGPHSHTVAFLFNDSDGQPLTGEHRYTMTFRADDLPPVRNHWELPIYDADGYFVANEIDRYALNSYMLDRGKLRIDDGEIVIPIQTQRPAAPDQARNWLPAPPGPF